MERVSISALVMKLLEPLQRVSNTRRWTCAWNDGSCSDCHQRYRLVPLIDKILVTKRSFHRNLEPQVMYVSGVNPRSGHRYQMQESHLASGPCLVLRQCRLTTAGMFMTPLLEISFSKRSVKPHPCASCPNLRTTCGSRSQPTNSRAAAVHAWQEMGTKSRLIGCLISFTFHFVRVARLL